MPVPFSPISIFSQFFLFNTQALDLNPNAPTSTHPPLCPPTTARRSTRRSAQCPPLSAMHNNEATAPQCETKACYRTAMQGNGTLSHRDARRLFSLNPTLTLHPTRPLYLLAALSPNFTYKYICAFSFFQ